MMVVAADKRAEHPARTGGEVHDQVGAQRYRFQEPHAQPLFVATA